MAKRVIRLTEADLENIVRKVLSEQSNGNINEIRITGGGKNKSYVLTPEDGSYKKWVKDILNDTAHGGRGKKERKSDPVAFFTDWLTNDSNLRAINEMYELMDETSADIFDSMPESFKAYCVAFYKTRVDELRRQFITADNPTSIQEVGTPGKVQEPGYQFSTVNDVMADQFEFNEAVLSANFKRHINDIVGRAKEMLSSTPNTRGVGELKSLTINASSSTIPNGVSKVTFPGKKPTFCELTEARAEAVKEYVMNAFNSINIKPSSDFRVNVNTNGTNGDCTSGPEWDKTEAGKEPLKKYQRADIGFTFAIRTESPGDTTDAQEGGLEVQTYMVTMGGRTRRKIRIDGGWPNVNLKITGGGTFKPVSVGCDAYRG